MQELTRVPDGRSTARASALERPAYRLGRWQESGNRYWQPKHLAHLEEVAAQYVPEPRERAIDECNWPVLVGTCTVPTHRDPSLKAVVQLDAAFTMPDTGTPADWVSVSCTEPGCRGPRSHALRLREEQRERARREAYEARPRAIWSAEKRTRSCSVTVCLLNDATGSVIVWTPWRFKCRSRIAEFTNLHLLRREERAAIVVNVAPSLRDDVRSVLKSVLDDYRWALDQRARRTA